MAIGKNIAAAMLRYKQLHDLSTVELAGELHLAVSTTQEYLNGNGNPRADTLELLAQQMSLPVVDLISSPPPEVDNVARAAYDIAALPSDRRERATQLLCELVKVFSGE